MSFASKWLVPLLSNEVSVVFRKRRPCNITPEWLYIYIGAPTSALIGRARIYSLTSLPSAEALLLATEGKIDIDELAAYAMGYDSLAIFRIGTLETPRSRLKLSDLFAQFGFSPPQSFFVLSKSGHINLDSAAGFGDQRSHKSNQ